MIRTLIFDFGNVVAFFDHQRAIARLSQFTPMHPAELTLALYGNALEFDYEAGRISTAEYFRLAKLHTGLTCSDEVFESTFVDIFWRNPEVCDLIPRLKPRYRLILASNTNDAHYRQFTQQFANVLQHFEYLGTSFNFGARKPHAEFFVGCQRHVEAEPEECLFIDDLASNTEAAARHGWKTIVYRAGENLAGQLSRMGVQFDGAVR